MRIEYLASYSSWNLCVRIDLHGAQFIEHMFRCKVMGRPGHDHGLYTNAKILLNICTNYHLAAVQFSANYLTSFILFIHLSNNYSNIQLTGFGEKF